MDIHHERYRTMFLLRLQSVARQWILIVAISVVGLLAFAKIGEDVFTHESTTFDAAVRSWMLAHQNPTLFNVFLVITWLGSGFAIIPATLVVAGWLWQRSGRWTAAVVVTAPAVATGLFDVIKFTYRRVRPSGALHLHILTYSFPSGHATTSAAVFPVVAYILAREHILSKRSAVALAVTGPFLIGFSRLYIDVHWATDVLGGWAAGLVVAALSVSVYERLRPGRANYSRRSSPNALR